MTTRIKFEHNYDAEFPCCARTLFNNDIVTAVGKSWDDAKMRLMAKINSVQSWPIIPESEVIDLP